MKISDSVAAIGAGMPILGRIAGLSPFFEGLIRESQEAETLIHEIAQISGIGVDDVRVLAGAVRFSTYSVAGWLYSIHAGLIEGELTADALREIIRRNKEPLGAQDAKENRS